MEDLQIGSAIRTSGRLRFIPTRTGNYVFDGPARNYPMLHVEWGKPEEEWNRGDRLEYWHPVPSGSNGVVIGIFSQGPYLGYVLKLADFPEKEGFSVLAQSVEMIPPLEQLAAVTDLETT